MMHGQTKIKVFLTSLPLADRLLEPTQHPIFCLSGFLPRNKTVARRN